MIQDIKTYTLNNGLRIVHQQSNDEVVYCGFQIAAGTRHEQPGEEGLAHFVEHTTFKGTQRHNALQIIRTLERVGGELNAYTNKEETVFYAACLREDLPLALDLLNDIVFHSIYPDQEVEKEKEVIVEEIESYNDSPAELIYDDFENIIFGNHPLGHNILGSIENVRSFTADDVRRFAAQHYRPENAVLFVSGGRFLERAWERESEGARILPSLPRSHALTLPRLSPPAPRSPLLIKHLNTHQAHVMIGNSAFRRNHPDRIALYLLNNILGGPGLSARLNLSLRERHGLVYTVESYMTAYSDTGLWAVYFGCDHEDINRCIRLVTRELHKLIDKPLSTRTLQQAKQQLKGQIGIAADNRENRALDLGKTFLHDGIVKTLPQLYSQIDDVTAGQLQHIATHLFADDCLQTLIYQ